MISESEGIPDLETVVNRTGLSRWEVIALISGETSPSAPTQQSISIITFNAVLVISIAVLCSWCFWRFFKKKRPKDKKKDGKKQVSQEAGICYSPRSD